MRLKGKYIMLFIAIACIGLRCAKPYNPSVVAVNNNYLVVEGNINTGTDSTTIKLSRATNIASGVTTLAELNANVAIQDNQNQTYSLTEKGNGTYTSPLLTLDPTRTYRVNITTSDGKNYTSDYVPATTSPAIDSIGFKIQSSGIQVYVNTHDPKNATHYYRWDYSEEWEFHALYNSNYITNGTQIILRSPSQQIYKCWTNDISTNIELGSSAKLTQDVIYQQPLTTVLSTSEKIEARYSILVKQYAMTTDGYNYYTLLKQNTEELGSIFDAQPSTLTGNIHCTADAALPVIGYITAGTVSEKRIYIDNTQLPRTWNATYPYDCTEDSALFVDSAYRPPQNDVALFLLSPTSYYIPTSAITQLTTIIGYRYSSHSCADCSIRGSTTPPSFWINGPYD